MKITRDKNGYRVRCSDHEFEILCVAIDQIEAGMPTETLTKTGHRRSWSRRTSGGQFMRIDVDRRDPAQ